MKCQATFKTPKAQNRIAAMLKKLETGMFTREELGDAAFISLSTARKYVQHMKDNDLVHIGDWRTIEMEFHAQHIALVKLGPGEDKPMPVTPTEEIRAKMKRLGVRKPKSDAEKRRMSEARRAKEVQEQVREVKPFADPFTSLCWNKRAA